MANELSVERRKAQIMVSYAMDNITKETQKVLQEYLQEKHFESLAKIIAYLELDYTKADEFLQAYDYDTRDKIFELSRKFHKTDEAVVAEADHIVKTAGVSCDDDFQIIKENLPAGGRDFAKDAVHNFRTTTPVLKPKLDKCLFEIKDIVYLRDLDIQKLLRDMDQRQIAAILRYESEEVQNKIFRNMSERAAKMLKDDIEMMGFISQSRLDACRARMINTILRLEASGDIEIFTKENFGEL